jgi:hypothetical protein
VTAVFADVPRVSSTPASTGVSGAPSTVALNLQNTSKGKSKPKPANEQQADVIERDSKDESKRLNLSFGDWRQSRTTTSEKRVSRDQSDGIRLAAAI